MLFSLYGAALLVLFSSLDHSTLALPVGPPAIAYQPHSTIEKLHVVPDDALKTSQHFDRLMKNTQGAVKAAQEESHRLFDYTGKLLEGFTENGSPGMIKAAIRSGRYSPLQSANHQQQELLDEVNSRHQHLQQFQRHFREINDQRRALEAKRYIGLNQKVDDYSVMAPLNYIVVNEGRLNLDALHSVDKEVAELQSSKE